MELREEYSDILAEVFNMGVGVAAAALSELVDNQYEIVLSVPDVSMVDLHEIVNDASGDSYQRICAVIQDYEGLFSGKAILLYSERQSLELVRLMLGDSVEVSEMTDFASDALCEVGNIVLNSCLASLSDYFDIELKSELPYVITSNFRDIIEQLQDIGVASRILYLRMSFRIADRDLSGRLGFVMNLGSLDGLETCLKEICETLGLH